MTGGYFYNSSAIKSGDKAGGRSVTFTNKNIVNKEKRCIFL